MDTLPETTLYSKLAKIMGEVERIPKSGKNEHFKYSFATEGDISDAIRKLLSEHNIAVFSSMVRWTQNPVGNTIKTICDFEFTLACGDTGATHVCQWSAEANDNQDKGFNKTATAAMKYWLLKTFMIPTGDDPDSDSTPAPKAGKVSNAAPQQRPQQKPPQPSKPATPPAVNHAEPDYGALELEERRKAVTALDNEAVTLFKTHYNALHNGQGNPRWDGMVQTADGATVPIVLWTEHVNLLKKAGYELQQDNVGLDITVITEVVGSERRIKSVVALDGKWMQLPAQNSANANVGVNSSNSDAPAWIFDRVKLLFQVGQRCPKVSFEERGSTVDKMHRENEFDKVGSLEGAVELVVRRLAKHKKEKVPA